MEKTLQRAKNILENGKKRGALTWYTLHKIMKIIFLVNYRQYNQSPIMLTTKM